MIMRTMRSAVLTTLSLLVAAGASAGQQNTPPAEPDQNTGISSLTGGQVDFGFRGTFFSDGSDEARYQRYQDLRTGPFAEAFRWGKSDDQQFWDVRATHVGYRDQQYAANYNKFGKMKASFEYNQIPLFFSQTARTAYTDAGNGVRSLDGYPAQVQSGAATSAIYNNVASAFDMQLKRTITDFRFTYSLTNNLDLSGSFKNTQKTGEQPWAGTFGFSNAVELTTPVDTRTTDVGVAAEWTANRGFVRVGYDGSFFSNNISTLVWDNPLRSTDDVSGGKGAARGRMALWPNSNLNSGSVSGLFKLANNSTATAYISLGNLSQDDTLIPFTSNGAIQSPPLSRPTADATAHITATAFSYNARPTPQWWFNARFRSYDFDNQTPAFAVAQTVKYDTSLGDLNDSSSPFAFSRKTLDLDASYTVAPQSALRAAYSLEKVDETFRTFSTTTQNTARLSIDTTRVKNLTLRAVYEYSKRTGTGLDEQSLDDNGEQTSLRQFDISDFSQNRFSAIVVARLAANLSVNGTAFAGNDNRPNTGFGLLTHDVGGVAFGLDYIPSDAVSVGASYQYETYSAFQRSRQASSGDEFNDPTRDWMTDSGDHTHTLNASADLLKLWPKTDVRFAYDFVSGQSTYVYELVPNTTLPPVSQLPAINNKRNRISADARYMITPHLGAGVVYWFEKYEVDDFAFSPATLNTVSQPSFISLQYAFFPYTANTIWGRVTYMW
jgi:MtrB/PioB family decaheme-associated outer membrane protein